MNCLSESDLQEYLDEEVSAPEMEAIRLHLLACPSCNELYNELSLSRDQLFTLLDKINRSEPEIEVPPFRGHRMLPSIRRVLIVTSIAASLLALIGTGTLYLLAGQRKAEREAENIRKAQYGISRDLDVNRLNAKKQIIIVETDASGEVTATYLAE